MILTPRSGLHIEGCQHTLGVVRCILREHLAHEVDRVFCTELLHDVGAVKLDCAWADAERATGLLA